MPKVTTERIRIDGAIKGELDFKYDISVNVEGFFTTTLPSDIVDLFENAHIDLRANRLHKKGFFSAPTLAELNKAVKSVCELYISKELITEKIVIEYAIQTRCTYAIANDGSIVPNCSYEWIEREFEDQPDNWWHQGNVDIHANKPSPFGLLVYAKPFIRKEYQYKSGKNKVELLRLSDSNDLVKDGTYLKWLVSVPNISTTDGTFGAFGMQIKEIDYTESVAEFFVNMIKSICLLNEKIKDFLEPDAIAFIAESKQKFLS